MRCFRDFKPEERRNYITLSTGEYYPDILEDACRLYTPVLETFSRLIKQSESSKALLINVAQTPSSWMRIQLCRVFRKSHRQAKFAESSETNFGQFMKCRRNSMHVLCRMKHCARCYGNIKIEEERDMI